MSPGATSAHLFVTLVTGMGTGPICILGTSTRYARYTRYASYSMLGVLVLGMLGILGMLDKLEY